MVVEERLGELLRDGLRQSFEKTEDRLVGGSGSGCAAAGCDYDCAVVGRILVAKERLAAADQESGQDLRSFEGKTEESCRMDQADA